MRLDGFISLASVTTSCGETLPAIEAVRRGLVEVPPRKAPKSWPTLGPGEVPVGTNLHTNAGRQLMIYCWGNKAPISDFACTKFGIGTGTTPPTVNDVSLVNGLAFHLGGLFKDVNAIDYPEPYIARVSITIGDTEAVGSLITEFGLYSGNGTIINRSLLDVGFSKTNVAKTFLWRLRF